MSDALGDNRRLRWYQVRLKWLFLLGLLVAVFCGGYAAATRRSEETVRADREARLRAEDALHAAEAELARLESLEILVFQGRVSEQTVAVIQQAVPGRYTWEGGFGNGSALGIPVRDLAKWKTAIDKLLRSGALQHYDSWGLNRDGFGLVPITSN